MQNRYLADISIIMVDDQDFILSLLRQMLRVLGAEDIRAHNNGEDAWDDFKSRASDIVIVDWQMQPMNGLQLTKLIRHSPESPNPYVPIIMVTAHREKEHVFTARDAGVTEYVVKPVSPKGLFSRIEAVIEKPRRFVRVSNFFGPDRRRHKKAFAGADRRGKKDAVSKKRIPADTETKEAAKNAEMDQDEINNTFNPDDVPLDDNTD